MAKRKKNPKETLYLVRSGDLEWLGKAVSEAAAVEAALLAQPEAILGRLLEVIAIAYEPVYQQTDVLLTKLGWAHEIVK